MPCPFCHEDHPHSDSPGAIVTHTTGCREWDETGKTPEQLKREELRRKVEELLAGGPEL